MSAVVAAPTNSALPVVRRRLGRRLWAPVLLRHALALTLAIAFMAPFVWTVLSSLKGPGEIYVFPPRWLPDTPLWENYGKVWQQVPFARFWINTIIITAFAVVGQVVTATIVAYGFARFRFPGRDILFLVVIATLVLPTEATLVPKFILFRYLHWMDTFLPLTVPFYFGGGPFYIFLLRQFLLTLPVELDEAAEIDGAGAMQTLAVVLVPLMKPALATAGIFSFFEHWNEFMSPLIYLRTTLKFPLSLGLRYFLNTPDSNREPTEALLMAASLMVLAPCILLFFLAQRYFVQGVVMSGLKG